MNQNPLSDVISFLLQQGWTTVVYSLLAFASVAIGVYAWRTLPAQRSLIHIGNWAMRFLVGSLWWQQSLWKLPPYYTDQPETPFGTTGLAHWIELIGQSAAIPLQPDFINRVVLPHFYVFAPIVYSLEVLTAVSLMLGFGARLFGVIGAFQILNLWLGLYSAPGEWPWTYFFPLLLMLGFALHRYGRSLGVDVLIAARPAAGFGLVHTLLTEAT